MTAPVRVVELGDSASARERVPASADAFLEWLGGPCILLEDGHDNARARVVSGLMHGDEPSGLRGIHAWLRSGETPAVRTAFFFGGVEAARLAPLYSHRFVPGRRDMNRCFRAPFDGPDGAVAEAALEVLRALRPEAVLDLHNNTGRNPAYGIVHALDDRHLALVQHFARIAVFSDLALGTFVEPFLEGVPAATIECGQAHAPEADAVAEAGLRRFLRMPHVEPTRVSDAPMRLLVNPVRVELLPGETLAFGSAPADASLTLEADLDRLNFEWVREGTRLGWVRGAAPPIRVTGPSGNDLAAAYFEVIQGELRAARGFVPTMITLSVAAATSDCLFYAAELAG